MGQLPGTAMKQFWIQVVTLVLVSFTALWVTFTPSVLSAVVGALKGVSAPSTPSTMKRINIISPSGQVKVTISAEVANTPYLRSRGLGGRDSLDENSGMLFVFDKPGKYQFWMKDMKIPLDLIWISGDRIVGIVENVPPPTGVEGEVLPFYSSAVPIDRVLEVNSGFARRYGIMVGDKLTESI